MCLFHTLLLRVLHHYSYVFSVEYYRLMVSTIVNLVIKPGVAVMCRHSLQGQSASSTPWCTGCFSACCGSIQRCCGAGFSAVHASRGEQAGVFFPCAPRAVAFACWQKLFWSFTCRPLCSGISLPEAVAYLQQLLL